MTSLLFSSRVDQLGSDGLAVQGFAALTCLHALTAPWLRINLDYAVFAQCAFRSRALVN